MSNIIHDGRTVLMVGDLVEVKPEERKQLEELAAEMTREAHHHQDGWLWRYARLHVQANLIFRSLRERSHSGPVSASLPDDLQPMKGKGRL